MNIPGKVIVAIACVITGLLVLVVVVGLLRNQVDTNGLALILAPIISGLLLGGGLRSARSSNDKSSNDKDEGAA